MTTVALVTPWRATPSRERALAAVTARWGKSFAELPDRYEWVSSRWYDAGDVPAGNKSFNLAASRNRGVRLQRHADIVVVNDADTFLTGPGLLSALDAVRDGSPLIHRPFTWYAPLAKIPAITDDLDRVPRVGPTTSHHLGGVYVCTIEAWFAVGPRGGGQDERFECWAPEDSAFHIAHRDKHGVFMPTHAGMAWHLPHERNNEGTQRQQDDAERLHWDYLTGVK